MMMVGEIGLEWAGAIAVSVVVMILIGVFIVKREKGEPKATAVPAPVDADRAATAMPGEPSEDVSERVAIPPPPADLAGEPGAARDYLPLPSVEWIVDITLPAGETLATADLVAMMDDEWREQHGTATLFILDPTTTRWTFGVSNESPEQASAAKVAWHFLRGLPGNDEPDDALFSQRLESLRSLLAERGATVASETSAESAVKRCHELVELLQNTPRDLTAITHSPSSQPFDGKKIWDVMHCLGLHWGDMDIFHLANPHEDCGDDHYFSVWTHAAPGYFIPEDIAADRVHVEDLVFGMSILRSYDPLATFDALAAASTYARARLGGINLVDAMGEDLDLPTLREHVATTAATWTAAGFPPGSPAALRLL